VSTSRRSFLAAAAVAGGMAPLAHALPIGDGAARMPKKILVLGGTSFLGPHFVRAATANGHTVTLFHRGRTDPGRFAGLEQLRGDRDKGDLDALKGRAFDAVVDTSGYFPAHVGATAKLLADSCRRYLFVSTISVYDALGQRPDRLDEGSPVATMTDAEAAAADETAQIGRFYGPLKARCEAAAEAAMPGRVCIVRPGLVVGPGDTSDRFTWWPVRCDRGGAVLAPGDPDGHVQFVDVRDLAAWMLHCVENDVTGTFNATGFHGRVSMAEVLAACKCATSAPVDFVWADERFLADNDVTQFLQMPLWIRREGRSVVDCSKAIAAGLRFRPIADTVRDTLQWAKSGAPRPFAHTGLTPEREAGLIARLRARGADQ
jgi:2'-hydroxyisoflavone reductase